MVKQQLEKILVGIDGSECAEKALEQAIEIAKKFSAELTVVNVYQAPEAQDLSQRILKKAEDILMSAGAKFKLVSFLSPNIPKVITDMAESQKFDLVVVGVRGMGQIKAWIVGSVCSKICFDSTVNVLIVK